jgi:hypothetical protein
MSFICFVYHLQHLDGRKPQQPKQRVCMGGLVIFRKRFDLGVDGGHRSVFRTCNVTSGASFYRSY